MRGGTGWPWVAVGAAVALAFVAGVGAGLAPRVPPTTPTPTPSASMRAPHVQPPGALAELARPQLPADVPRIRVGHRLVRSTFRVIDSSVLSNIYVARDVDGRICVVAIPIDDQFSAACGSDPSGLDTPLLLTYTVIPPGQTPVEALAGVDVTR